MMCYLDGFSMHQHKSSCEFVKDRKPYILYNQLTHTHTKCLFIWKWLAEFRQLRVHNNIYRLRLLFRLFFFGRDENLRNAKKAHTHPYPHTSTVTDTYEKQQQHTKKPLRNAKYYAKCCYSYEMIRSAQNIWAHRYKKRSKAVQKKRRHRGICKAVCVRLCIHVYAWYKCVCQSRAVKKFGFSLSKTAKQNDIISTKNHNLKKKQSLCFGIHAKREKKLKF